MSNNHPRIITVQSYHSHRIAELVGGRGVDRARKQIAKRRIRIVVVIARRRVRIVAVVVVAKRRVRIVVVAIRRK